MPKSLELIPPAAKGGAGREIGRICIGFFYTPVILASIIAAVASPFWFGPAYASENQASADQASTEPEAASSPRFEGIETFFDGVMHTLLSSNKIPGATLSVVSKDEIVFAKGYGFADVARARPVDAEETLFRTGSVSKAFTWVAVMQLVERGRLDLDVDVNAYLSQFQIPATYDQPVTMRHIMTHTAGFEDGAYGYLFHKDPSKLKSLPAALEAHMPALVRAPGAFAAYSNWATALAGLIVANVSGVDFETYVEENIFSPLGMTRSTFREPVSEPLNRRMSASLMRSGGDYVDGGFEYIGDFGPAGALSTTAVDMARFMRALLRDGGDEVNGRILQPATARLMRTRLFAQHDALPAMLYGFYEETHNGRTAFGHAGSTLHFHSKTMMLTDEKVGVFVSFNAPGGGLEQVYSSFFDQYFPRARVDMHPAPDAEFATANQIAALAEYAGAYRVLRRTYTSWEKAMMLRGDMHVSIAPKGGLVLGGWQRYIAKADDIFRSVDDPDDLIAFIRDDRGEVTHLVVGETPFMAYKRTPVLEQAATHQAALGLSLIVFVGVLIGSLSGGAKWFTMSSGEKAGRAGVFIASAINLLFIVAFAVAVLGAGAHLIVEGVKGVSVLLTLPVIAALFAAASAVMVVPAWRDGYWSLFGRLRYTAVVATLLLFAVLLNYWNLFGPWRA